MSVKVRKPVTTSGPKMIPRNPTRETIGRYGRRNIIPQVTSDAPTERSLRISLWQLLSLQGFIKDSDRLPTLKMDDFRRVEGNHAKDVAGQP
jgi:hypothetical protein